MDHQQKCTYRRDTLQVSQALQVSKYHIHTRVKMTTLHSTHLSVTRFFSSKINGSIETKLKKLYKKKGDKAKLTSYRFIHLKDWAGKMMEKLSVI